MKGLLGDAFTILFARGFIRISQLISFILLARFLTTEEFGWFGIITTSIALASTLGSLGLRQSIAHEIGQGRIIAEDAVGKIVLIWPFLSIISALFVFFLYGNSIPGIRPSELMLAIISGIGSSMIIVMLQGVLLGGGDIRGFSRTETIPKLLFVLFLFLIVLFGFVNLSLAIWAYCISFLFCIPFALNISVKKWGSVKINSRKLGKLISYGLIFAVNMFLVTLCSRISMFFIEHYYDSSSAGKFFAAIRVNDIILEAATALGLALFSKSVRSNDSDAVISKTARVACFIFWSFSAGAVLIAYFASSILVAIIGIDYEDAGTALMILALGLGAAAANKIIYPAIAGQGRPLFGLPVIAISLIVNVTLSILLIPYFGINGAALSLVAGQYIMLIGYILTCKIKFRTPFFYFLLPRIGDLRFIKEKIFFSFKKL